MHELLVMLCLSSPAVSGTARVKVSSVPAGLGDSGGVSEPSCKALPMKTDCSWLYQLPSSPSIHAIMQYMLCISNSGLNTYNNSSLQCLLLQCSNAWIQFKEFPLLTGSITTLASFLFIYEFLAKHDLIGTLLHYYCMALVQQNCRMYETFKIKIPLNVTI